MSGLLNPVSFLVACLSGWLNEHQQHAIDYLTEDNRGLREQIGDRRLRFTMINGVDLLFAPNSSVGRPSRRLPPS